MAFGVEKALIPLVAEPIANARLGDQILRARGVELELRADVRDVHA